MPMMMKVLTHKITRHRRHQKLRGKRSILGIVKSRLDIKMMNLSNCITWLAIQEIIGMNKKRTYLLFRNQQDGIHTNTSKVLEIQLGSRIINIPLVTWFQTHFQKRSTLKHMKTQPAGIVINQSKMTWMI